MMLAALLAVGWYVAWAAPETPIGGALHRWLVARPAAVLGRITRGQLLLTVGLVLLLSGAAWLGQDALNIAALGSPELLAALASIDAAVWLDVAAGALIAWTAARAAGLRGRPRRPLRQTGRQRRAARPRRLVPDNDDGKDGGRRRAA